MAINIRLVHESELKALRVVFDSIGTTWESGKILDALAEFSMQSTGLEAAEQPIGSIYNWN